MRHCSRENLTELGQAYGPVSEGVEERVDASDPGFPSGDVEGVYRTVLDELYYPPGKKPRLVLLHELAEVMWAQLECPRIPAHKSDIDTLTIQNFLRVSLYRRQIRHSITYRLPFRLFTLHSQAFLAAIGASLPATDISRHDHPWWLGFMHAYPEAWGYATVTQVGFNPAHSEALLQVKHRCGTKCGSTEIIFLRKVNGRWRVVERMQQEESRHDPGYRSLRFRGVGAEMPWLEAGPKAVADSIRQARLPRAIRGTLTDSATGARLAFARMSVLPYPGPYSPVDYTYSDSQGRYLIQNPPMGRVAMIVHCPKSTARAGEHVEWGHVMVSAGSDTTFDFTMIKLSRCAKSP